MASTRSAADSSRVENSLLLGDSNSRSMTTCGISADLSTADNRVMFQ